MIVAIACALLALALSWALGAAATRLLGWTDPGPVAVTIGFALALSISALAIRLPGRATTLAVILAVLGVAATVYAVRAGRRPAGAELAIALGASALLIALGSIPFALAGQAGVLGEGVYTNDHAAQLYWTDWLRNGFGPEPTAVAFGYPTGPQSLTAALAEPFGAELIDAFNGLLLAVAPLTALAALTPLREVRPPLRLVSAVLVGLPYLSASYLAQSAFKETVMAALVVALAVVLTALGRGAPARAVAACVAILGAGALFTYSVPGLAWFALGIPLWLVLEALLGRRVTVDRDRVRGFVRSRLGIALGAGLLVALALGVVLAGGEIVSFAKRIGAVQSSVGRLSSPVWPGEALGVWFEGDFRVVRGQAPLAYPATLLGLAAAALGVWAALRRRDLGLLSLLLTCAAIYAGAYLFASIYVEAKALAILTPLVVLGAVIGLFGPGVGGGRAIGIARGALGAVFVVAALVSTLLALRAAPVGFDERGRSLEAIAERIDGEKILYLGVDRFGSYWLRGTLAQSPGGYFAPEVTARPQKRWQQGDPLDFDSVDQARIDRFDFAITTAAAVGSTPPGNWSEAFREGEFIVWRRDGTTEPVDTLNEGGAPGRVLECLPGEGGEEAADRIAAEAGSELLGTATRPELDADNPELDDLAAELERRQATVLGEPVLADRSGWGREAPFEAGGEATRTLELDPGTWDISLQYASQTPVEVEVAGGVTELPASLSGMYLTEKGGGSFWPAGRVTVSEGGEPVRVTVRSEPTTGLERAVGAERLTWLGDLAATSADPPRSVPLEEACGLFVDHFTPSYAEPVEATEPDTPEGGP